MRKFIKRFFGKVSHPLETVLDESGPLPAKLKKAVGLYIKKVGAERGCLLLEIPETPTEFVYAGPSQLEKQFPFSRAVVDAVLDQGRGFYCHDSHEEFGGANSESLNSQGSRSFVCAPINDGETHLGVIYLDNPTAKGLFSQDSLQDLEQFAKLIARALEGGESSSS